MHELIPDGGVIRKLWIHEADQYRDHLLRLDSASRRNRFGGSVSDDRIREHVNGSILLDAVIHGCFIDGVLRGAAELRPIGTAFSGKAEAAFSVETPWQSHGVGSELLSRTLLAARNRGIKFLQMNCLADNRRMQQLARKFDADLHFDFGSIVGEVTSPRPTALSVMREAVADGQSVANALLDAHTRLFKPT
jgi:GNAT superfamily N-acetyltransferase